VVGCSHPGIDRIVESASAINPRIRFIAGGFHLVVASDPDIEKIVTALHDRFFVITNHCARNRVNVQNMPTVPATFYFSWMKLNHVNTYWSQAPRRHHNRARWPSHLYCTQGDPGKLCVNNSSHFPIGPGFLLPSGTSSLSVWPKASDCHLFPVTYSLSTVDYRRRIS